MAGHLQADKMSVLPDTIAVPCNKRRAIRVSHIGDDVRVTSHIIIIPVFKSGNLPWSSFEILNIWKNVYKAISPMHFTYK